ncbi:MAG TPA: DUF4230 domain-containing protein [Anaerolineaceae bacterium]|nr:DUF4230 domain-containing protein [Anaerolineaceae bacterium]
MDKRKFWILIVGLTLVLVVVIIGIPLIVKEIIQQTADQAVAPVQQDSNLLKTQVAQLLHPTPTILPDPVTIVHEVRALARLETIQYTVEKVITAEEGQGQLSALFGDKLLFVAHGVVIAGVDLAKMNPQDIWIDNQILYFRLPQPEIFSSTLDNTKSYVYDRQTGILTKGDTNLETQARQSAENEITQAALDDGILNQAGINAQSYLTRLLTQLGYPDVKFVPALPQPSETPLD